MHIIPILTCSILIFETFGLESLVCRLTRFRSRVGKLSLLAASVGRSSGLNPFFKRVDNQIFSGAEYDSCFVKDADGKLNRRSSSVYHPEGLMHSTDIQKAMSCDAQWNLPADALNLAGGDRTLLKRAATRRAPGPEMGRAEWEKR